LWNNGLPETILVVDDNVGVLNIVVKILTAANFLVLSALNGEAALALALKHRGTIDLLLSDVDMPAMSGPELGEALKKSRPDIHVMLMSGGKTDSLLVLNYGWAFLAKPFIAKRLVEMIEDVLHSPNRSQTGGQEFDTRKNIKQEE
jgi:two-component system, cell cycle sensor histidine kinase and response regulator CckA